MLRLECDTEPGWIAAVMRDFDAFVLDHASCERKASATGLNLVAHYPDRRLLVREMIAFAQEELEHFAQVMRIVEARGLVLERDSKDAYVGALLKHVRRGPDSYFLDRLLVAGIVEARGCERFGLVAEALQPGDLKEFYAGITRSEARHHGLFVRVAKEYVEPAVVDSRLAELLVKEASIVAALPMRAAVH